MSLGGDPIAHAGREPVSFRLVLQVALLAGVLAGATVGVFHLVASEPVLERAIGLEEHAGEVQVVSREAQRIGLAAGFILYGLAIGLLVAIAFALVLRAVPGGNDVTKAVVLIGTAYWCLALAPFLKYPANPPGVGEPGTVEFRQATLLGFMALMVAGAGLSFFLLRYRRLRAGDGGEWTSGWWMVAAVNAICFTLLFAALPDHGDPISLPSDLLLQFRWLALAGLTLFWTMFGVVFGFTLHRTTAKATGGHEL